MQDVVTEFKENKKKFMEQSEIVIENLKMLQFRCEQMEVELILSQFVNKDKKEEVIRLGKELIEILKELNEEL